MCDYLQSVQHHHRKTCCGKKNPLRCWGMRPIKTHHPPSLALFTPYTGIWVAPNTRVLNILWMWETNPTAARTSKQLAVIDWCTGIGTPRENSQRAPACRGVSYLITGTLLGLYMSVYVGVYIAKTNCNVFKTIDWKHFIKLFGFIVAVLNKSGRFFFYFLLAHIFKMPDSNNTTGEGEGRRDARNDAVHPAITVRSKERWKRWMNHFPLHFHRIKDYVRRRLFQYTFEKLY